MSPAAENRSGTAVVVGASSGIGAALAMRLAHEARSVAILARRPEQLKEVADRINQKVGARRVIAYRHDAAELHEVDDCFDRIEEDLGEVAELYYVAGVMPAVALNEFDTDKDRLMFQVNTLGCIAWVNAAARRFLPRKRGLIVGIGSVAGDRGRSGRPGYCSSKAGQDSFLESIRNRLWRHGIQVTTIRPGFVETEMTEGEKMRGAISADRAALLILRARDRRRAIAYVPFKWSVIMRVVRAIPSCVFRRLNI